MHYCINLHKYFLKKELKENNGMNEHVAQQIQLLDIIYKLYHPRLIRFLLEKLFYILIRNKNIHIKTNV